MLYLIQKNQSHGIIRHKVWEDVSDIDFWMMERDYHTSEDNNWWLDCSGNRVCEVGCNSGSVDIDGALIVLRFVTSYDADAEELEIICEECFEDAALEALQDSKYLDWAIFDDCVRILLRKTRRGLGRLLIAELLPIAERLDEVEALQRNVLEIKCAGDIESYNINYGAILGELE